MVKVVSFFAVSADGECIAAPPLTPIVASAIAQTTAAPLNLLTPRRIRTGLLTPLLVCDRSQ
jgi:hypothetical protein